LPRQTRNSLLSAGIGAFECLSQPSDLDSLIRAKFQVKDSFLLPEEQVEYKVVYDDRSKGNFAELHSALKAKGYTPHLFGSKEDATLLLRKDQEEAVSRSRIPVAFLLLTLASVVAFSILQAVIYEQLAPQVPTYAVVLPYSACVVAILLAHELGHRRSAARAGMSPPTPYFLPGVPGVTAFLPSVGLVSSQKDSAVNLDSFFDSTLSGPVAALVVVAAIYVVGEFFWVQSSITVESAQALNSFITVGPINPSAFQWTIDALLSPFIRSVPDGYVRMSPLLDAGTVGFFLTFLNLLPITQFDGGNLLSSAFSTRALRVTTLLSAVALALVDTPNYLLLSVIILLIGGRQTSVRVLDEISPASKTRKVLFFVTLAVAVLSLPIPMNVATLGLG
jgi:Zn-dependent protease